LELIRNVFIARRTEDSGHKYPDNELAKKKVLSYERHLDNFGISPLNYVDVYELACIIHATKGANGPFGLDEVIMGASAFLSKKNQVKRFVSEEKVEKKDCPNCDGTGLEYSNGKIQYEVVAGEKKGKRCKNCYES
jgi:hypothetical protein